MLQYLKKTYPKSQEDFHNKADTALINNEKMFIVTANPEIFMTGEANAEFDKVLCSDEVTIVPDGIGVVKAMQRAKLPTEGRIPGVELSEHLLRTAAGEGKTVAFLGAKQEVLDALLKKCKENYPGLNVVAAVNGYVADKDKALEEILEKKPDLVLVALGVPSQELLIARHIGKAEKGIFIGVGGTFDVLSGTKQRAPSIFIKMNCEWLYRILKEPSRIKRFYNSNVKFFSVLNKALKSEK